MNKVYDLTEGSIFKKIITIALPVLLTSISQMAYNLTDMFWIGKVDDIGIVEDVAVSAIGTAGYILWFSFGLILIAKIGTSVKVSHSVGKKDMEGVQKYASNGLLLQILFGLMTSALILIFRRPFVLMFNIEDGSAVYQNAIQYLTICGGFYVVQFITNGFAAINEGLGKTFTNLLILPIGLAVNMILDPLMILVWKMGVAGAAYATVIAQVVTLMVYILVYIFNKQKVFVLHREVFDLRVSKEICKIGFPAGIQNMFFAGCSIIIGIMVMDFGNPVFTAQRVGSQIEQFSWMIAGGFQTALTVFVGQNYGAKNNARIKKGTLLISSILIPYSAIIALVFLTSSESLIRIFLSSEDSVAFGKEYLKIISFSQVFMMAEGIASGVFHGVGKTKIPSISGIIGNIMRIPLAFLLIPSMAQRGIWWSLNISDGFKGTFLIIGVIVLFVQMNKNAKQINQQKILETV